jgi:putative inorganic carbon (hco3(-)) transporter
MKLLNFCNKTIEYSFYLLFFLVPFAFTNDTSELFEFNKLWVTFIITVVIGFAWITKMIIKRQLRIQRTPLDIPIALFLVSEVISTVISLDPHTSIWGYYSRFNGGLLSILSYIFLYFAFVSNLKEEEKDLVQKFEAKRVYIFVIGVVAFFIGALISSQIKSSGGVGIPYQLLANLLTVLVSFAIIMKAAPHGIIKRSLYAILSSAFLVMLWGLPSHFGYDPTCLLFRGTLDVSCWTSDFQPKIRIFSTLGQPDWLAAYLAALIPLIGVLFLNLVTESKIVFNKTFSFLKDQKFWISAALFVFFAIAYLALLYTRARSAVIATWLIVPLLLIWYFWFYIKPKFEAKKLNLDFKLALLLFLTLGIVAFFAGQPFGQLQKFEFQNLISRFNKPAATKTTVTPAATPTPPPSPVSTGELGGTDSSTIRLLVWTGAIDIWKNNPIFGSGLETFAYAYYQYRPAAHNLTSEWKYLYNKAHNEYLNYLATTGTIGIITYLSMIGCFLFLTFRYLLRRKNKLHDKDLIIVSLIAGYGTILITNFFGFSVVMINVLFYLFPAFVFILAGKIDYNKSYALPSSAKDVFVLNKLQKALIIIAAVISIYLIFTLINFWNADRNYYYGKNYDDPSIADYERAYPFLRNAVALRPSEPTFKDEFSYNNAVLGASLLVQAQKQPAAQQQQAQTVAKQLIESAINYSNEVTTAHPNDIVFWKTRVRVFYTLGQLDPSYLSLALEAIKRAAVLAPTDADVSYNLGVLYGQNGDFKNAVKTLENTIRLKRDYVSPYYALGIFYHQLAIDASGKVIDTTYNQKAIAEMQLTLKYFGPNQQVSDAIKQWQK